ncbi:MAG: PA0069 family radical SAM protein [Pseudomonadota bacterium]
MDGRLADRGRKGRGTSRQPAHRFTSERREAFDDGWATLEEEAARPPSRTEIRDDSARRALSYNASPDVPFDRAVNPYRGCEHGCIYCYARPSHGTFGLSPGLDFETKLFAKRNVVALLRRELAHPAYVPEPIYLSGVTDAYQPLERIERLTRGVLELLLAARHPVGIVTKAKLICRDLDLLVPLAAADLVQVFVSVTTLDPALARRLEPRTAMPKARLETIARLADAGVPVGILQAPIIPGLNDHETEAILSAGAAAGARSAHFTLLRLPHELKELWDDWLDEHAPAKKARVLALQRRARGGRLNDPRFGSRMVGEGVYADMLHQRFALARRRLGLDRPRRELRTDLFVRPDGDELQPRLL